MIWNGVDFDLWVCLFVFCGFVFCDVIENLFLGLETDYFVAIASRNDESNFLLNILAFVIEIEVMILMYRFENLKM